MFNVTIRQVGIEEREEIIICCHEISDEVMSLANSIKGQKSFLLASKDGEMFKLDTKEIFYIESVDNKTFIYCKNNIYETKQKLYELEEILKGTKFFRCSKSMILNIGKIRSVSPSVNSRFEAKLVNGETAIISRQYVPTLKKKLGMRGIVMNDSLKEIIKEVIKDFFIITVAMLFVVSLANSIALIEYYPPYFPWVVMGTGAVTSIPTLLFYFKEEPTKLQARIRIVIHFCLIQAIVMTEGFLLGWYKNFPMAFLVFAMVTAVYLLTFLFSYITRTSTAKSINESLKKFNADEDYQDE